MRAEMEYQNMSLVLADQNTMLMKCWRLQSCEQCLEAEEASISCGWCPYSSACIPSRSLLAPLTNSAICPLASERWELRSSGLGCNVSTRNFLSVIVAVIATLCLVALFMGIYVLWQRRERRRREWRLWETLGNDESEEGWWKWLGLEDLLGSPPWEGWGQQGWGGWTRGWLLWRREEPMGRIPGAWQEDEDEEHEDLGERRPLLGR